MTISAMGRKSLVLCLAACLFLSSFHEVSCQVEGSKDLTTKKESVSEGSWEQITTVTNKKTVAASLSEENLDDSVDFHNTVQSEAGRGDHDEVGQRSTSMMDEINRELEAHLGGLNKQAGSTESRNQYSSVGNGLKKGNDASGMLGSVGIAQTDENQEKNGVKEEEGDSIFIPKYDIDAIIREESTYQGSASKTSSLIASLTQIVENHRKEKLSSSGVTTGTSSKLTQSSETVEKLKVTLKKYRGISVRELVARSDFQEIVAIASRYEELSSASVSYIPRLSMYGSVVKEGIKASQRVQLAQTRASLHKDMADEKQKNVDAEFALVKALAESGDMLYVKIYAIKKLVLTLEAEKEEVNMSFHKTAGNLSRVLEEASQAYEEYHLLVRKWKEEQATEEFSREAIQSAEEVWVKFLGTLDNQDFCVSSLLKYLLSLLFLLLKLSLLFTFYIFSFSLSNIKLHAGTSLHEHLVKFFFCILMFRNE